MQTAAMLQSMVLQMLHGPPRAVKFDLQADDKSEPTFAHATVTSTSRAAQWHIQKHLETHAGSGNGREPAGVPRTGRRDPDDYNPGNRLKPEKIFVFKNASKSCHESEHNGMLNPGTTGNRQMGPETDSAK